LICPIDYIVIAYLLKILLHNCDKRAGPAPAACLGNRGPVPNMLPDR
jgi:hypothetical protein